MKAIDPNSLVDMQKTADARGIPLRCDLIYRDAAHPLNQTFKTALYQVGARLWLHQDLAEIVLLAARDCHEQHELIFVLTDGLRTVDAQKLMHDTPAVRAHPEWTISGPQLLLSKPGTGGHCRGMAIDIMLVTQDGETIDMGTQLDYFTTDPDNNPAARAYPDLSATVKANRKILDDAMTGAASKLDLPLHLLSSEWWDFRMPSYIYNQYAPLSDADLPESMRMSL